MNFITYHSQLTTRYPLIIIIGL